ncbi:cytochrome c oxidase assembly protein [Pareuzebyella sediminis]|uniref:cytochrome c oxidase assembly protein n=1 Tax=Pareuzebyella sediminis TaxID=2607998 RepID=UPI0018E1B15B|nr:cytochrome c oxidase assembly protein [Pareuzebyella sediminis]
MSGMEYFLRFENWSAGWLLFFVFLWISHVVVLKSSRVHKVCFASGLFILYLVFGSPLALLSEYGLHSTAMVKQMLIVMVAPILILNGVPKNIFAGSMRNDFWNSGNSKKLVMVAWFLGALAMWGGHFFGAIVMSAKTGLAICGISAPIEGWFSAVPENLILAVLLLMGVLFALPVFNPNRSHRIGALQSVAYLFTSCVSCSILGLYVTFSAVSNATLNTTTLRNPFSLSSIADQELAGMLMWVPGCFLYVFLCMAILMRWYDEKEGQLKPQPLIMKTKKIEQIHT